MGGRGPAPKASGQRVRMNTSAVPTTTIPFIPAEQPPLPRGHWPKRTRDWWAMWGASAQSEMFTLTDWDFLLDTARLHAAYWNDDDPDLKLANELRIRVAKFGATIEDRTRLRIQFAEADKADDERHGSSRDRFGDLHVLPASESAG